jgi:hypothetical protein
VSQYPYQPPSPGTYGYGYFGQDPLGDLLLPAKRASICMFVLSALTLPCGVLAGLLWGMLVKGRLPPEMNAQYQQLEEQLSSMGLSLSGLAATIASALLIVGVIMVVLGVMVRRGGLGSVVVGIIVCGLLALFALLSVAGSVLQAGQRGGEALGGACLWGVVLVLLIFTLVFLIQAAGKASKIAAYRQSLPHAYGAVGVPGYAPAALWPQQQSGVGQWGQGGWAPGSPSSAVPPPPPPPPPSQQQNWPPPSPPPPPTNPT